jgi:heptosyltransferase-2
VIRGGGLGDFILILPVLAALRHHWPTAEVELLSNPEMGELAKNSRYAESVRSIHDSKVATLFSDHPPDSQRDIVRYLKGFDLVISFLHDRNGRLEENIRAFVPQTLFVSPPIENQVHAASQFLTSLLVLGIHSGNLLPRLESSPQARAIARETLPSLFADPTSFPIAVHPGSGSARKNWSARGFSETILWVKDELGYESVVITGEADTEPRQRLQQELGGIFPFELSSVPLLRLASILQCCRLLIGNDSGISHLAAALGTPVLALFGPTSPEVWRPLGKRVRILRFEEASPDRVHKEIRKLL